MMHVMSRDVLGRGLSKDSLLFKRQFDRQYAMKMCVSQYLTQPQDSDWILRLECQVS